jgi:acyl-CoA synthetase (AMP-forming)/AMP-acid ligase II
MKLETLASQPTRPTTEPARRSSLVEGGPLVIEPGTPETLTEALQSTAKAYPHKGICLIGPDQRESFLSYPALVERAARVAGGLAAAGLKPGDYVILQLDTLDAYFASFWGCLLCGIVPVTVAIAPTYKERNGVVNKLHNTWMLLGHPAVITSARLADAISGLKEMLPMDGLNVVRVEHLLESAPARDFHQPKPTDVAFIQLSSGSTGVPKCIQEAHRSVIAHIHSSRQFNGYSSDDVTVNWLPMDHVVPILTFHLKDTYLGCAQVHVPTDLVLAEPLLWLDLLEKHRATHTWAPNFGFKLVADRLARAEKKPRDLGAVKFFMNAGEQVTLPVVREFLAAVKPFGVRERAMQPAFGMAEVCTCMTYANDFSVAGGARKFLKSSLNGPLEPAPEGATEAAEFVGLGTVTPGIAIRIADAANRVLPEGVIGRFQIKGPVVTPGYFNNPEANQDAFVGDGWFNSGDLGFVWDGELFLTGREKEMIIIRGAKFYCYEIEDVVNGAPGVEPTFVAACGIGDPRSGTETLAVFFSPQGITDDLNLAQAIRKRVTARMGLAPGHVIPVPKKDFPKTTSGKIQRTQLKKLLESGAFAAVQEAIEADARSAGGRPPQTETERRLAGIWENVLGVPSMGVATHLFDLGGDSLRATQIVSRIRGEWRIEFPLPLVFDGAGTVETMARWIDDNRGREEVHAPPAIQPVPRHGPLPLSHSQLRIWLAEQIDPGTAAYNICRAVTLAGPLDPAALEHALNEIVVRHEILRTVYRFADMPAQEIMDATPIELARHDLGHLEAVERGRIAANLASQEAARPFDLESGPLFRAKLIRLRSEEHRLILVFHQIVIDAWSIGIFCRELGELYASFAAGRPNPLPPLPVQYADYAFWQQRWFSDAALDGQLKYWKRKLEGELPALSLAEEFSPTDANTATARRLVLRPPLLQEIRAFNAAEGSTLYLTLLSVYTMLLHQRSGATELVIGSPESGRRQTETEPLLGYFVNMLPLRNRVAPDKSFRQLLAGVRATAIEAFAHGDVPFEKLLQAMPGKGASGGHGPFFQTWCGPIDSLQPFSMGDVSARPEMLFPPEAQFDLALFIAEQPEEVACLFEFKTGVWSRATSEALPDQFEKLLRAAIAAPDRPVHEIIAAVEDQANDPTATDVLSDATA